MAIKKSDLYASLWASCDQLRGGMDASQYKDYVLFMLFIKYISDKYGNSEDFTPAVTIPKGASFRDMVALKGKSDIGDRINTQIIQPLIDANARLARSDFPDFNDPNKLGDGREMVDRLTNLIGIFQKPELDFSQNRAEHDDILGDAYEYLMRHFATESGKSKGQFYTPSEVSRVIAQVIGISAQNTKAATTAYDPTCGSGSLLLKVAAQAGKQITLEGQEKNVTTAGLARMNMILHDFPTANILSGNTLAAPKFKDGEQLRTYDYVVANPPFSDKTWSTGLTPANDPFQRFAWGVPPARQGDYAYLLHIIRSMKSTGIPACIVVLDKENAAARKGVFLIDASRGFIKDGPKNRLREQDIHRIVDTFTRQADVPHYARMVPLVEISDPKNDYNLNLPRYIDSTEPEDIQDIDGHLRGGIPERDLDALADYWQVLPGVRAALFESAGRPGYARLRMALPEVRPVILHHPEFTAFNQTVTQRFVCWRAAATKQLTAFGKDDIVFNRTSETDSELGLAAVYLGDEQVVFGGFVIRGRPIDDALDPKYSGYALRAKMIRSQIIPMGQGAVRANIGQQNLRRVLAAVPPKAEQRAIAAALSDVDALLVGLDRLIAKKRDLKQAAMQQLLTGRTLLPGFHGEWEVKRLGDHVTFLRNGVNSRAELLLEGRVKYLHYGDIHASTDSYISPQTLPSLPDAKAARLDRLRDGDVIFADASEDIAGVCKSVELRSARDIEVVSGLHTIAARFDETVLADGFKGLLQYCPSFATHLRRLAAGTKVYATNRAHIASVEMRLPSVAEQTAIATVLSDMDAELAALEARRDKTRALKQAMMQELLTGRTRLVRSKD